MPRKRELTVADLAYRATHKKEAAARSKVRRLAHPEQRKEIDRRYKVANKEKIRIQKREWRKANPDKHSAANKRWKINRALKLCDFAALMDAQNGKCAICQSNEAGRRASGRLAIDHCHDTGKVRGLLCHRCNSMLGLAKDRVTTLQNAIAYLEKHSDSGAVR